MMILLAALGGLMVGAGIAYAFFLNFHKMISMNIFRFFSTMENVANP